MENTDNKKSFSENNHELSKNIINSKKPLIIIGQSILKLNSGKYIFESIKKFFKKNNKINNEWNSLNILSNNASTVGNFDLDIFQSNDGENKVLNEFK